MPNFAALNLLSKNVYICSAKIRQGMCLYQTKMVNPHYLPSIKNGGKVPMYKDVRHTHLYVDCGWCVECRKKIANSWRVRLYEEIKDNPNAEFVTFSFAPEDVATLENEIKSKKYKGLEGEEIDVNILAAYAIRMFTERWRKKYKKTPRHWFITELGHTNSERIHLHGIMWNTSEVEREEFVNDIRKKWGYGNVFVGRYVNERTINYIVKYVTKLDDDHIGYKQKIFVSKSLGAGYLDRVGNVVNVFRGEATVTQYTTYNGFKIELPRYYKLKLYSDEEREYLWTRELDKNRIYIKGIEFKLTYQDEQDVRERFYNALRKAREENEANGYGTNLTKHYKYIVTELMKMDSKMIKKSNKNIVKCVVRRELAEVQSWQEGRENSESLNKAMFTDTVRAGQYIGSTTEGERKRNRDMAEAELLGVSVRTLNLIRHGIITNLNFGNDE